MGTLESFYFFVLIVQLIHSVEELSTGFHKGWYLFTMSFWMFLAFEIVFSLFWILVLFNTSFIFRAELQAFFLLLMFANGVQHLVWAGFAKKYVPGLITAPIHIVLFLVFFYQVLFS